MMRFLINAITAVAILAGAGYGSKQMAAEVADVFDAPMQSIAAALDKANK